MQQQVLLQKKIVNSRWTGVFSSAQWGKKIFASKKIWFGNSRTNVFLGQNILFRLRIICTCCLYNKHACRKLDWSTSFKIHIRCQVFDKIPVWFWFFFLKIQILSYTPCAMVIFHPEMKYWKLFHKLAKSVSTTTRRKLCRDLKINESIIFASKV